MKLYDYTSAPNPRRVRIFLAEKGVEMETVQIDLAKREQFSEAFTKINPLCDVPVLELDDGSHISQVHSICRYLEEVFPENPLFGRDPVERAMVESQHHLVQLNGGMAAAEAFRNSTPGFANRALTGPHSYAQIPELAARGLQRLDHWFEDMDAHLADSQYLVGDYFSVADIGAYTTVGFARWVKKTIPAQCTNLQRWFNQVDARPSSKA
ncbi:MAG: glutathione S-transferase family protein [Porticoccaceae bacterium]